MYTSELSHCMHAATIVRTCKGNTLCTDGCCWKTASREIVDIVTTTPSMRQASLESRDGYQFTYMHTYIHTKVHTHIRVCIHTYAYIYIYAYIHIHTYMHTTGVRRTSGRPCTSAYAATCFTAATQIVGIPTEFTKLRREETCVQFVACVSECSG